VVLHVATKSDLPQRWNEAELLKKIPGAALIRVSSKNGQGLDALKERIIDAGMKGLSFGMLDGVLLTQSRHEDAMRRAEKAMGHVAETLQSSQLSAEFLAGDLRDCLDALGEIVGKTSRQDVLNAIFSKFCIGK
jgi:tRNA modification GTPase